eukprot:1150081-Pelagomonas_calceolata.AAC.7
MTGSQVRLSPTNDSHPCASISVLGFEKAPGARPCGQVLGLLMGHQMACARHKQEHAACSNSARHPEDTECWEACKGAASEAEP